MRASLSILALSLSLSLVARCADDDDDEGILGPRGDGAVHLVDAGSPMPTSTDLPCEVAQTLASHCWTCHGSPPAAGVPTSLVTFADLTHASIVDPSVSYADRSVVRMRAAMLPMPPAGARVTEPEIAALEAWIAAGTPAGSCDDVHDPFDTPTVCTSDQRWVFGNLESPNMRPGGACVACHSAMHEGPLFSIAGTVYPSAHEPDDCNGTSVRGEAIIEITGSDGGSFQLMPNAVGNFFSTTFVALPYTARVLYMGRERVMATPQMSGDCNACHTLDGAMDAPGRVVLP